MRRNADFSRVFYFMKTQELIGKRFGKLYVESHVLVNEKYGTHLKCRCDCGVVIAIAVCSLKSGKKDSCGCNANHNSGNKIKHGHNRRGFKSNTYKTWSSMMQRCSSSYGFNSYSGKGISICERWKKYENFLEDMGERPNGMSIDRIDVNGNYEPSNCRWANRLTQSNNTTKNVYFTYKGETLSMAEWARKLGLSYDTFRNRIKQHKWTIEKAIETPARKNILT